MSEPSNLPAPALPERYDVKELLGHGGMGSVYLANDRDMDRAVVIKVVKEVVGDERGHKRFVREAKTMARFNHPNIVAVYDHGLTPNGQPFLCMEYIEGQTLGSHMRARGALPEDAALAIADQILNALIAAHEKGLVHRDLKPANVMLTAKAGGLELVKVLDFGVAKLLDVSALDDDAGETLTLPGAMVGTPGYMAPEQITAEGVDHRADIYALGAILYELVTGAKPVAGETARQVLLGHLQSRLVDIHSHGVAVSGHVAAIVRRALAGEASERFQTALEMKAALGKGERSGIGLIGGGWSSDSAAVVGTVDGTIPPALDLGSAATAEAQAIRAEVTESAIDPITLRPDGAPGTEPGLDVAVGSSEGEAEAATSAAPGSVAEPVRRSNAGNWVPWVVGGVVAIVALFLIFGRQPAPPPVPAPPQAAADSPPSAPPTPPTREADTSVPSPPAGPGATDPSPVVATPDASASSEDEAEPAEAAATDEPAVDLGDSTKAGPQPKGRKKRRKEKRAKRCEDGQIPVDGGCMVVPETEWPSAQQCIAGEVDICYRLAQPHLAGGVSKPLAFAYYENGCAGGGADSCYFYGNIVLGRRGRNSLKKAESSWKRGCNLGYLEACSELARSYESGTPFGENRAEAARLAVKLCESKWGARCFQAAEHTLAGEHLQYDKPLALTFLSRACEKNHKRACARHKELSGALPTP